MKSISVFCFRLHDRGHGDRPAGHRRSSPGLGLSILATGRDTAAGPLSAPVIRRVPEVTPDVLLMPLLAFDRHGNRLGYGGGLL